MRVVCTARTHAPRGKLNLDWLLPGSLVALSLIPVAAGTFRVVTLAGGARITPENARFFAAPGPVVLHIVTAIVFCVLGALQFSPGLRRRKPRWHRLAGRVVGCAASSQASPACG